MEMEASVDHESNTPTKDLKAFMSLSITTHEALVLSSAGGSPRVATVTVSPHAHHRSYNYPRSLNLDPFNHLAHVKELNIDGEVYCMYYALIPCMPINRTVLELLGLRDIPKGRLMYRGDVFFLKVKGPSDRAQVTTSTCMAAQTIGKRMVKHETVGVVSNPGSRRELSDNEFGKPQVAANGYLK
ncbi:hypothetical protein AG1IA_05740 [Rhizoctonia solani AG-1 IA]|uniref:Uncharacterized protein n=1 Tax=Thanatephorus cucumeris (strain AG1-IA) TaxID=983506 RepID=L8WQF0_THACA|nr:hypothetical protein AG1IA_05740 [Rhizoctonia solani AG-1 IA]